MNGYKKHRGLKKYYLKLEFENDLRKMKWLDLSRKNTWFDNWHLHFDWKGYGNNSFKRRKPHLNKLFRHFDLLFQETKKLQTEFQLYAIILDYESYDDAVFLNTPNPNREFPFKMDLQLQKESTLKNEKLNSYINELKGYEKLYGIAEESFCLLFIKDVGVQLH